MSYRTGDTLPADPIAGGAISASATDPGDVHHNTLTVEGLDITGRNLYGGYTQSVVGDATGNEVVLKNMPNVSFGSNDCKIYGGWSKNGKATGNTVTLSGSAGPTIHGMHGYAYIYGGYSGKSGATAADHTQGNTLQVTAKNSAAYSIAYFEKMKFVLGSGIDSGDTMLYIRGYGQNFDWGNISVDNAAAWMSGARGTKRVTLYTGPSIQLSNYNAAAGTTAGNFEYGIRSNTTRPAESTVTASEIYFEVNQFKETLIKHG